MDQSDPKGAFGETLARYYHQSESKTAVTSWPEQSTFAITRLHSEVGLPDVSQPIPEEAAIHVSIAIKPVPLRSYELYIDDRRIGRFSRQPVRGPEFVFLERLAWLEVA